MTGPLRKALLEAVAPLNLDDVSVYSRKIDYPNGPGFVEIELVLGVGLSSPEELDDLLGPIKEHIEADRRLGGLAADSRVARVVGPSKTQEGFVGEWFINVSTEE